MDDLDLYLQTLYGGQEGYVYVAAKGGPTWIRQHFKWPLEEQRLRDYVMTICHEYEVYLAPALFDRPSAKKEHVKGSQVVWVEFDGNAKLDPSLPTPALRVQSSSTGHEHVYWRIPFAPKDVFEPINRKLTYFLDADSSGWDASQILRPPLTFNHKRQKAVSLISGVALIAPVGVEKFDVLPEIPPPVETYVLEDLPDWKDVLGTHKTINHELYKLIKGPIPVDRSNYLMYVGHRLAESGLTHEEIVSLLLVVDDHVGKFVGREDRLTRLVEIASIAIQKHSVESATSVYSLGAFVELELKFEEVWGPLIVARGNMILAGSPGVGKTQLCLQLGYALALGEAEFLGFPISGPKRVMFVEMDMQDNGLQRIVRQQLSFYSGGQQNAISQNFTVVPTGAHIPWDELERLMNECQPDIIFFDSLSQMSLGPVAAEEEAKKILDWETRIRQTGDCSTVFVHHNRKANENNRHPNKQDDIYGSYLYGAKLDTGIIFHRQTQGHNKGLLLSFRKVRYGLGDFDLALDKDNDRLLFKLVDGQSIPTPMTSAEYQSANSQPGSDGSPTKPPFGKAFFKDKDSQP